jgi:hypothetical protein
MDRFLNEDVAEPSHIHIPRPSRAANVPLTSERLDGADFLTLVECGHAACSAHAERE